MSKWKTVRLGDVATYINGYAFKPSDWSDSGLPIIRIQNLTGNDYETNYYQGNYNVKYEVLPGDILISWSASLGIFEWKKEKALLNQHIFKVVFDKLSVEKSYFVHTVSYLLDEMEKEVHGSTMKHITKPRFDNTPFPYPPIEQQHKIASNLDKVTHTIDICNAILEKLDELIKARFVEMFGEPISNPMGWEIKKLSELSELITNGNTPKGGSENYVDSGVLFLRSQNVWRNRIDLDDVAYIDDETHKKMKKSSVHYNDILITKTGRINTENSSLGRAALFQGDDNSANINGHVYLVRLKNIVSPKFVVTILTGEAYRKYIRKVCVGGIDKRQINLDQVEDFPIIMPPLELQNQFADFVKQVDKSKVAVQKELDKTKMLFDSLMQEYFG